jgi:hypothetical protein
MSDSGRTIGDCEHGHTPSYCIYCLHEAIRQVHSQRADDLCWMDVDKIFVAAGLPVPDRRVGDKEAMLKNCRRYIDTMCQGGGWPTYAELEAKVKLLTFQRGVFEAALGAMQARAEEAEAVVRRLAIAFDMSTFDVYETAVAARELVKRMPPAKEG